MALKEIPMKSGEQLVFSAIEMCDLVNRIGAIELEKQLMNRDWNEELKMLKRRLFKLAEAGAKGQ